MNRNGTIFNSRSTERMGNENGSRIAVAKRPCLIKAGEIQKNPPNKEGITPEESGLIFFERFDLKDKNPIDRRLLLLQQAKERLDYSVALAEPGVDEELAAIIAGPIVPAHSLLIKHQPILPQEAPEKWSKQTTEKAPDFIRRVYAPWIGNGLTQPLIRRLDPALYKALYSWLRSNDLPDDLPLPKQSEVMAKRNAEIHATPDTTVEAKTAHRAVQAMLMREHRAKKRGM